MTGWNQLLFVLWPCGSGLLIGDLLFVEQAGQDLGKKDSLEGGGVLQGQLPSQTKVTLGLGR
jgi:hypothetical protein